jgi:DNA-binding MarR family transcriptional regulator
MENRADTALIALRRILKVTEMNARRLARQSELTASQLLVMHHIRQAGAALTSGIAAAVDLKQATVTVIVNKLQDAGLVFRKRDIEDRRCVWIRLTDAGLATLDRSPDLLQTRFEQAFSGLDDWEQAMICSTLERVAVMLDADEIDAAPVLDVGELDRIVEEGSPDT